MHTKTKLGKEIIVKFFCLSEALKEVVAIGTGLVVGCIMTILPVVCGSIHNKKFFHGSIYNKCKLIFNLLESLEVQEKTS